VPGARVNADADRLLRVMANLLSNAAKFSPEGSSVEVSASRRGGGLLRVSVADHGSGIPFDFKGKVFHKFAQASPAPGAPRRPGTGLGLSIAKAIVESLGGRISFEATPGGGTTFCFELPEAAPAQPPTAA
jgi:signal transduction histidine kinase